ncbi:hypothetical protein CKO42_20565 [Lamprobacter modestohalophilus]|uniref:Uncharacterized protein n=1 Tax=Lamprobacter modestohalophilus TaxID=1064514 RepID=A0A9X0WCS0_9GAMM|nr:hypothetical protein [Lamprobacter modestohalophilus]
MGRRCCRSIVGLRPSYGVQQLGYHRSIAGARLYDGAFDPSSRSIGDGYPSPRNLRLTHGNE